MPVAHDLGKPLISKHQTNHPKKGGNGGARLRRAPQRIPFGEPGCQGRSPGFTKFPQDRTETRIKLKVARGQVARYEPGCAGLGRAGIGWAGLGSAGPARAPFEPGTQNSSFLFSGIFELRAACIYNPSQLGFFAGGFDAEPGAP